jgi:hypothetical protein
MLDYAATYGIIVAGGITASVASYYLIEFLKN